MKIEMLALILYDGITGLQYYCYVCRQQQWQTGKRPDEWRG